MRLALFEPDIPQNAGALIRLGACVGITVDIIEPCGFVFSDRQFKRSGMDYLERADIVRHESWSAFRGTLQGRLILLTSKGSQPYCDFAFQTGDTLLLGRESAGVPENVHDAADARLRIPLKPGLRSLNVARGQWCLGKHCGRRAGSRRDRLAILKSHPHIVGQDTTKPRQTARRTTCSIIAACRDSYWPFVRPDRAAAGHPDRPDAGGR